MEWNEQDGIRAVRHMKTRASCRSFQDRPIPEELLRDILEAGLRAASGGNLQPFSMVVVKDPNTRRQLYEILGQKFVQEAAVDIFFILDFYKMRIYAEHARAPYTCNESYFHFMIALQDIMCTAQTMESAAHLCSLGSCYVGTCLIRARQLITLLNLPEMTSPVLMLAMGYPRTQPRCSDRLPFESMVFEERYREMPVQEIVDAYDEKYAGRNYSLPTKEPYRTQTLEKFKRALGTTYAEDEVEEIIGEVARDGILHVMQRQFGLHYHALDLPCWGQEAVQVMDSQKLDPFYRASSASQDSPSGKGE